MRCQTTPTWVREASFDHHSRSSEVVSLPHSAYLISQNLSVSVISTCSVFRTCYLFYNEKLTTSMSHCASRNKTNALTSWAAFNLNSEFDVRNFATCCSALELCSVSHLRLHQRDHGEQEEEPDQLLRLHHILRRRQEGWQFNRNHFGLSLRLKNHLSFGLIFPKLLKSSKIGSLDKSHH